MDDMNDRNDSQARVSEVAERLRPAIESLERLSDGQLVGTEPTEHPITGRLSVHVTARDGRQVAVDRSTSGELTLRTRVDGESWNALTDAQAAEYLGVTLPVWSLSRARLEIGLTEVATSGPGQATAVPPAEGHQVEYTFATQDPEGDLASTQGLLRDHFGAKIFEVSGWENGGGPDGGVRITFPSRIPLGVPASSLPSLEVARDLVASEVAPWASTRDHILVREGSDPGRVFDAVAQTAAGIDPGISVYGFAYDVRGARITIETPSSATGQVAREQLVHLALEVSAEESARVTAGRDPAALASELRASLAQRRENLVWMVDPGGPLDPPVAAAAAAPAAAAPRPRSRLRSWGDQIFAPPQSASGPTRGNQLGL